MFSITQGEIRAYVESIVMYKVQNYYTASGLGTIWKEFWLGHFYLRSTATDV